MATFLTPTPFHGVKQMKYEQLLETNPEWVKQATKEEVEGYLEEVQQRYSKRVMELAEQLFAEANPPQTGCAPFEAADRAAEQARQMALQEILQE